MMVLAWPALAQAPAAMPPSPAAQETPGDPAMTGATARPTVPRSGRPTPPAFRPKREPRPYKVCLQRARERGLRGGDRRSFITRCQLGYGPPIRRS
jgi:hypothetical protein